MKFLRRILLFGVITALSFQLSSQNLNDISAGVIDFLLQNPKSADRMINEQAVALSIISDLLKTESERQHQLQYATSGRNQITIHTDTGKQVQFVKDEKGEILLLVDGIVYPIAQELIDQSLESNVAEYYDLETIKKEFNKPKEKVVENYYQVLEEGEFLSDIIKKFNTSVENVYILLGKRAYKIIADWRYKKEVDGRKKLKSKTNLLIKIEVFETRILPIFTCKWFEDFDGDGSYSFKEFKQLKKTFYSNENFYVIVPCKTDSAQYANLNFRIFNGNSGVLVKSEERKIISDTFQILIFTINSNELITGLYEINARINGTNLSSNAAFYIR